MKPISLLQKFWGCKKEFYKIDYKPIKFRIFKHLNGCMTLAINRYRLKVWGWWK